MTTTSNLIRVNAPKHSGLQTHNCARCGHEELTHPVWLGTPNGNDAAPYGTGCAAHLIGTTETALRAELAREELTSTPELEALNHYYNVIRPGRFTAKLAKLATNSVANLGYRCAPETAEHGYRLWKAAQAA